ncbi:unnamed protein product [Parnassius mnemosyne]|uniref:Breast cancer type 2 susceptibility protein n=1 Tax=Parnassius mnemosyne TaxID=213953 RepID=A0AAV1LFL0_9NEOP
MERSSDMMKNFEAALKGTNTRKPPQIYIEKAEEVSVMPYSERHYSANDVLLNISKQLTSLQNADSIRKDFNINHKMVKHKKCALIPVNMLSLDDNRIFEEENCFASNKFDTQCVSDTQLINIVVNAEKMVIPKGDTQEFENSFCEQLVQREEASKNLVDSLCYNDRYDKEFELVKDLTTPIHSIIPNVPSTSKSHNSNEGNLPKNYSTNMLDAQKDENENEEIDIIVQNVNIMEENDKTSSEVTQDFENSFCGQHVGKEEASKILTNSLCYYDRHDKDIELVTDLNIPIPSIIPKVPSTSTSKDHNVNEGNQAINYSTNILDTQKETDIEVHNVDKTQENVKNSPVINYIKPISLHSSSVPLIYTLDAFENFAALAFPVIEKNFEAAQYVINSQIIDKELCLGNHIKKSTLQKEDRPISPVLSIKMNSTSTLVKDNIVKKKLWKDPDKSIVFKQGISVSIEKEVKSFEDEILFSSDEEKDFQELPFTCAIETSFNNQPDILDKTMYVGFQTASNKSIQINADSFSKAKNILEDVDINNHKLTLTELVTMCDIGNINNVSQLNKGNNNNNNKNEAKSSLKDITNINDSVVNNKPKESIEGTNTITKEPKSSSVLQASNRKCEINFEQVNMANEMKFDIKSTDSNHIYSKIKTAIGKNLMKNRDLLEFHTASNKTIKLTEKALARCRQVFVDFDLDEKYDQTESENTRCYKQLNYTPKDNSDFKENEVRKQSESTEIDDQNIIKEFENDLLSNTRSENASSGMEIENKILSRCLLDTEENENYADTALNKKPCKNISDVVLQHRVDEKSCLKNHTERYTTKVTFVGFKTASNKQIDISEKALTKSKNIFDDLDFRELTSGDMNLFDEYKTLNIKDNKFFKEQYVERNDNKTKTGSELENNQSIKDLEKKHVILEKESPQFDVFQTAGKKSVKMSPEAVFKTKNLSEEMHISRIDVKDFSSEVGNALFKEFKTASDKPIKVSKEALIKTRNIFQDIDLGGEINENSHNNSTTYELHKNFEKQCFQNEPAIIEGFKPASNKNMNIADEDLTKSKMLFQNMKMIYDDDGHIDTLQSTFNKKRTIFSTVDNCDRYTKSENLFYRNQNLHKLRDKTLKDFKTSSNNKVPMSDEALAKNKKLFQDIEINAKYDEKKGVSELETAHNKHDFNDNNQFTKNIQISDKIFKGFQTASNKQVNISNEALAKSRKLFQDIEINDKYDEQKEISELETVHNKHNVNNNSQFTKISDQIFKGFQTASNKQVNISNEALAKSKKLFQDIEINDKYDEQNVVSELETVHNKHNFNDNSQFTKNIQISDQIFKGFKTASNKQVNISNEALAKSKKLFQDIEINNKYDEQNVVSELETVHNKHNFNDNSQFTKISDQIFKGFQTASNKQVYISNEALAKSKKLFQDIEINDKYNEQNVISELEAVHTKHNFNDNSQYNKNIQISDQIFKGFQTASNKQVNISNDALAKSKKLFQDIEINGKYDDQKVIFELETVHNKHNFNDNSQFTKISDQIFKGFQTASNKQVNISDEALVKSKKLFQDIEINNKYDERNVISELETVHNKHDFNDYSQFTKNIQISDQIFKGFQTASNKQVNISDEALVKSKKLFQDIEINDKYDEQNVFSELETVHNKHSFNDSSQFTKNIQISDQSFKGFQTASNKQVNISNDALAKSKKLLQDFARNHEQNELNELTGNISHVKPINDDIECRAANNNNINTFLESVTKSKKRKLDFNRNNEILNVQNKSIKETSVNTKENINLDGIIDTQVLNNFEETLHTEDFCKETKHNKSKRSGSPILSCPRAKKRSRFAVPFKNEHKTTEEVTIKVTSESSTNILFVFNESYKKTKKYTLKTLKTTETLNSAQNEIDQYILNFNFDNVLDFKFSDKRNELTDDQWSIEDLKKQFLSLVSRKIIPDGWLDNHLKLIILKLISYEIEYCDTMQGICSVKNVLQQLKYRYDRELYNVERPALRKLLEKDDVSTRTMILRVLAIYVDGVAVTSMSNGSNIELLVTDGWYCIKACLDQMLIKLVRDHKIRVGTKLATHGAELLNCDQGKAPWEDTSSVRLKLFGNSTRRARWDARLGYHGAGAILAPLSCVELEGGKVSKLRALVTRVYPTLYVEKFEDGSTVTRSERLEQLHQMKYESERQALLEKIYEEVEKEFADEESQDSECDSEVRTSLNSGSQIKRFMKQCKDPAEFRAHLTSSQCALLQDYTNKRREKLIQSVQTRVEERLKGKGLHVGRNVVPVLKIRVADVGKNGEISKAMMSVWRPNDAILDIIQEGSWINVYNIVPTAMRYSEIQLSAGRQTIFSRTIFKENDKVKAMVTNLKRTCYSIKDLAMNPMITTDYNEVDTVGLIFLIDPPSEQFQSVKAQFQNVYLTDEEKNLICINFWGGLKKFGYENVLDTCQVVACMNLQKRFGNTKKSIPQFRATEFSYFTKTSKLANVRKMTEELSKALSCVNIKRFCQECIEKKNNCSVLRNNCEKISPYRINYSDYNVSKHKMFIDSPLTRKPNPIEDILNLSGLDFESTFRQIDTQDISPSVLSRKKKVEEKIAKLKMYGEPPPLNPIHIINKSKNATSAFKSPLSSKNDTSNSVANEKSKDNTNVIVRNKQSSPVIYGGNNCVKRKNASPIKLNFPSDVPEKENKGSQVVDPFAEEFDGSPPLSLD